MSEDLSLDPDARALLRKPRPIGWFTAGFLFLVSVGLIVALYLPLRKAHDRLIEEHRALAQKAKELNGILLRTRTELEAAQAERTALRAERAAADKQKTDMAFRFEQAAATAGQQLDKLAQAQSASVRNGEADVAITLDQRQLFVGESARVSPAVKKPVCAALESLARNRDWSVRIRVPVGPLTHPSADTKSWTPALERAGALGAWLAETCQVPSERIWTGIGVDLAEPDEQSVTEEQPVHGAATKPGLVRAGSNKKATPNPAPSHVLLSIQALASSDPLAQATAP